MQNKIQKVVIVGGGTSGWITASLLAKVMGKQLDIELVESDAIGIIGVGEATIPPIIPFNHALAIDENEFIKKTKATIKLGIQFENWGQQGDSYMHAFGGIGKDFPFCEFYQYWLKSHQQGKGGDFWDYSLNFQAAKHNKFAKLATLPGTQIPGISYAYHFDAGLYAQFLSEHAKSLGVKRTEGTITSVSQCEKSQHITGVTLASGQHIEGDLFIDCSGLRALLIEQTLHAGFEDWSHWLPCDRAMAVPSSHPDGEIVPYTRAIAHHSGWQWRIPLQHRVGNGLVYSSQFMSDDEAKKLLLENLDGEPLAEPRPIQFKTGRRRKQWHRNVIAIGLSSGFLEPLESTSLHLVQTAAIRLIKYFPHQGINDAMVAKFNQESQVEFERIRDFVILHYHLTARRDSAFWRHVSSMPIPSTLQEKITLFKENAKLNREDDELFTEIAWQQVLIGQGLIPEQTHPLAERFTDEQRDDLFASLKTLVDSAVKGMPSHSDFLNQIKGQA